MDCCFANQYDSSQITETFPNVSSPEMFDSDTESDTDNKNVETLTVANTLAVIPSREPTQAELIAKSDSYMLIRINKFLSGVPPPPRQTTCQSDCSDFLQHIYKNRQLFYIGYPLSTESLESTESTQQLRIAETNDGNASNRCAKGTLKNLTTAFNTCDLPVDSAKDTKLDINNSNNDDSNVQYSVPKELKNPVNAIKETVQVPPIVDNSDVSHERSPLLYHTIDENEAKTLTWPQAYSHKFHGIQ